MQVPVATKAPNTKTRRTDPVTLRDFNCFQPNGEVWCFCNTEPRIKAIRRVTRKESSPNLGREFWSCGNWVEGEACGFFLWCDQAQRMGRTFVTPPPPQPQNYVQPTDAQRRRPSPAPFSAATTGAVKPTLPLSPTSSPTKRSYADSQQTAQEVIDSFEDVDLPAPEEDEDEIIDDHEPVDTPATPSSPTKKARFDSFAGPVSPQTPSRKNGNSARTNPASSTTYAAIQADPDSPFHAIQRALFADMSSTPASSAAQPTTSTNGHPCTRTPIATAAAAGSDAFSSLANALAPVASLLEAAQKEYDKDSRLLLAAKRKEETLRRSYEKERDEKERLRKENEGLKNRIKLLEHEMLELRLRKC
ncbi:hypothetical protein JCM10908_003712 [Rhodotorula pacifica]|uniref:uncharacterized protein n=1 Tax=Rhodotorula pacifica TaxID=1495444 RepID=UPI00316CA75E